jgi:hypothetical protein
MNNIKRNFYNKTLLIKYITIISNKIERVININYFLVLNDSMKIVFQ